MCFLKTFKPLDKIIGQKGTFCSQLKQEEVPENDCINNFSFQNQVFAFLSLYPQQELMMHQKFAKLLKESAQSIHSMDKIITESQACLQRSFLSLSDPVPQPNSMCPAIKLEENMNRTPKLKFPPNSSKKSRLLETVFGKRTYKYELQLADKFSSLLYKERNVNLAVRLVDKNGSLAVNSNIIHLCLGICDGNAEWIPETKSGQYFMKGKTQVELYHGEGSFQKIYPRDVSRLYPFGKVNFVVYTKPSLLKFSSNANSMEQFVNSEDISPLIITDITIKAKKKSQQLRPLA